MKKRKAKVPPIPVPDPTIFIKAQFGAGNQIELSIPGKTPRGDLRKEIKRRLPNVTIAEVELVDGSNLVLIYEDKKKKSKGKTKKKGRK